MFSFVNRVCLITGAGSPTGIGFATAKGLGCAGGTVIIIATTSRIFERAKELESMGINAEGVICDLTDINQVNRMIDAIIGKYKKIDVLVNNAGISSTASAGNNNSNEKAHPYFYEVSESKWDRVLDTNLNTNVNITKRVLRKMRENGYGRIVNVSSVTGPRVTQAGLAAYSCAKAALIGLSKAIALEEGINNITCNCVLPGWVDTGVLNENGLNIAKNTPVGRAGSTDEIASAIIYLASSEASYVTGQELVVDGGNIIQEIKGNEKIY